MRTAVVMEGIPEPGRSGGAMALWTVIAHLRGRGHDVSATLLLREWDSGRTETDLSTKEAALKGLGVEVRLVPVPAGADADGRRPRVLRSVLVPAEALYAHRHVRGEVQHHLAERRPEAVLGFDTGALVALRGFVTAPVFAIPGDPAWLVSAYRLRLAARTPSPRIMRECAQWVATAPKMRKLALDLAREFGGVGMFGEQHAAWLRRHGVDCRYLPVPVEDRSHLTPERAASIVRASPPRALVLGGLSSTATQMGLWLLAREVLPRLAQGGVGVEVHVVGGGRLPDQLESALRNGGALLRGYVDDAAAEMRAASVYLVPSPYPVGARTRIVEAMSAGSAIVAHGLAASGLPELEHDRNSLLARDGSGLAEAVIRLVADDALRRRLCGGARQTYDASFAPAISCRIIEDELTRLAAGSET